MPILDNVASSGASSSLQSTAPAHATPLSSWAIGLCLAVFLSSTTHFASTELAARKGHREESPQHQLAIALKVPMLIDGERGDISEYRNRVLVPYMLLGLQRLGILGTDQQRYSVIRLTSGVLMFLTVWWLATSELTLSIGLSVAFSCLLAMWFIASYNVPWEIPTDFIDIMGIAFAIALARRRRYLAMATLVLVASLNRESSAYFGVLLICEALTESRRPSPTLFIGGALVALAIVETVLLRAANALPHADLHNHLMLTKNFKTLALAIRALPWPGWLVPLVSGMSAIACWLWVRSRFSTRNDLVLILTACAIVVPTFFVTSVQELRVYLPSTFLLLAAAMSREARANRAEALDRPAIA